MSVTIASETISDSIFAKSTQSWLLEFKEIIEVDDVDTEVVIDITGWTIYYIVKSNVYDDDVDAVIFKTITDFYDAENGQAIIELDEDDTDIDPDYYEYTIYAVTNLNERIDICNSNLIVKKSGKE